MPTKCPTQKVMHSMDRVMDAISTYNTQYQDGLLHRGEAIRGMMSKLIELQESDLMEAQRTVESYGYDATRFSAFMKANGNG